MIKKSLDLYRSFLDKPDHLNIKVSKWSVYAHTEHVFIANTKILDQILNYDSSNTPTGKINMLGRVVLLLGAIPRGKGKAPDFSIPTGLDQEELKVLYLSLIDKVKKAESLEIKNISVKHPYFGFLNLKQWLRFIEIHQKHHLKIIKKILA